MTRLPAISATTSAAMALHRLSPRPPTHAFTTGGIFAFLLVTMASASNTNLRAHLIGNNGAPLEGNRQLKEVITMFGPDATGGVKNYDEAVDFCKTKGLALASHSDYCMGKEPYDGVKAGDNWSPIADYQNGWVQVGDTSSHPVCVTHLDRTGVDPGWGEASDKAKQKFENNYILCKKPGLSMFGPDATGDVKNYDEAVGFCKMKGLALASLSDYCDGNVPYGGPKTGDNWSPIADFRNGWVQVGDTPVHAVCVTHLDGTGGNPEWGKATDQTKHGFENNYILCTQIDTYFLVIAGGKVIGTFAELEAAKTELAKFPVTATVPSRMIAELKNGQLLEDPHEVGGQGQAPANGFHSFWHDWGDINAMIAVANDFVKKYDRDILMLLGDLNLPADPNERLVAMEPLINEIRSKLKETNPTLESQLTGQQIYDLVFPTIAQTSSFLTQGGGSSGPSSSDSPGCTEAMGLLLHHSFRAWFRGDLHTPQEANKAGLIVASKVNKAEVRQRQPFRSGSLGKSDEDIFMIAKGLFRFAFDTVGVGEIIKSTMEPWKDDWKSYYKFGLAASISGYVAHNAAILKIGEAEDSQSYGGNVLLKSRLDEKGPFNWAKMGKETTFREDFHYWIDRFNEQCQPLSKCPEGWAEAGDKENGYACTRSYTDSCGEECAKSECFANIGVWAGLDPCCNPYTCHFGETCPAGWEKRGPGLNGKTGLTCSTAWEESCDESCAQRQCTNHKGTWSGLDSSENPFTCYFGPTCPSQTGLSQIKWVPAGLGKDGKGLACTRPHDFFCPELCAKITCEGADGSWSGLDPKSNPYTCYLE